MMFFIFLNQIRWKIKNFIFDFKMRCQRFKRGYADIDWWEMDKWFVPTTKKLLTELRNNTHSYPNEFESIEDWHKILNEMIYYLDHMDLEKETDKIFSEFNNLSWEDRKKKLKEKQNEVAFCKIKFFYLFQQYFYDLNLWG